MGFNPDWKQKYAILKEYISSNPEISIGHYETSIPRDLRDEFYEKFDHIRRAIVLSWGSPIYPDVCNLGKAYTEAENRLFTILALKKHIELPVDLATILNNPEEGMMRLIYDRLFELIQGKITENDFEKMAEETLNANALEMFRLGYELWAAISIILLLEPDRIFKVDLNEDFEPFVTGIDRIVLGSQYHHPSKRIPELILHSKRFNAHVAFKMPTAREVDLYTLPVELPTQKMLRDRTGDTSAALSRRMIFLAIVSDLKKIPVFADLHERQVGSPDLTIEFLMENELSDTVTMSYIQNRLKIMTPRFGGGIVLMNPNGESDAYETENKITAYSVGINEGRLIPLLDRLML
jgi:hypothetical protein